jgi:DNA-binding NtrC family response regulator
LICATHQDLKKRVGEGCFREDLLYRIDVVHIHIPPLRERAEDILWLARKFLDQWSRKQGQARKHLDPDAEQALLEHDWPGNVRDLRHCLERACIFTEGTTIRREALFPAGMGGLCEATASTAPNPGLREYLTSCEKRYIEHCLETNEGRIGDTAEDLGISRKSLWERMRKLHIG